MQDKMKITSENGTRKGNVINLTSAGSHRLKTLLMTYNQSQISYSGSSSDTAYKDLFFFQNLVV